MNVFGIIACFEYDKALSYYNGGSKWIINSGVKVHIRKVGERNLVLYIEMPDTATNISKYVSKYKAKHIKNKWRLQIKSGLQINFDDHHISNKIDELIAEIYLLG